MTPLKDPIVTKGLTCTEPGYVAFHLIRNVNADGTRGPLRLAATISPYDPAANKSAPQTMTINVVDAETLSNSMPELAALLENVDDVIGSLVNDGVPDQAAKIASIDNGFQK